MAAEYGGEMEELEEARTLQGYGASGVLPPGIINS